LYEASSLFKRKIPKGKAGKERTMTEEQAKTKWCPMTRLEGNEEGPFNRMAFSLKRWFKWECTSPYQENAANCIASDCMMWRWQRTPERAKEMGRKALSHEYYEEDGYCGLTGELT